MRDALGVPGQRGTIVRIGAGLGPFHVSGRVGGGRATTEGFWPAVIAVVVVIGLIGMAVTWAIANAVFILIVVGGIVGVAVILIVFSKTTGVPVLAERDDEC
jgi:hypothetical protein